MSIAQLAAAEVVPVVVIFDFEGGYGRPKPEDLTALQGALERACASEDRAAPSLQTS